MGVLNILKTMKDSGRLKSVQLEMTRVLKHEANRGRFKSGIHYEIGADPGTLFRCVVA